MQGKTMYLNCRRWGFDLTEEEAIEYVALWADTWPEVKQYFTSFEDEKVDASIFEGQKKEQEVSELEEGEEDEEETLVGEQVQLYKNYNNLGMWRVRASKNASLNFPFQSLAAVVTKRALWYIFLDSQEHGYKLVNEIHDEAIAEIPEEIAAETAERIGQLMVKAANEIMPGMFIKAEPALMRRWSKEAEPAFDKNGKLIPYEDAVEEEGK